jgi:hypothetical protein
MASAIGLGQVIIRGTEISGQAPGNSASVSAVHINTLDRDIVPLIKEDKDTKVDTQESQSITKTRLNDGTYFNWRDRTTVTKGGAPGQTVRSSTLVETDREGQSRVIERADTTISRSASGEQEQAEVYRRNSSGELVIDHVADVNTVKGTSGPANRTTIEKTADVNGNLSLLKQVDSVAVSDGPGERVITAETKTVDHLDGKPSVTAQETTSVTAQGNTTRSDSVVRTPGRFGWKETSRTITAEAKAPDGSVSRETVVYGRSIFSTKTGNAMLEPLVPRTKIVEREVHQPDGSILQQRDVYHRDVNGGWVPETFSTKEADKGLNN